MPHRTSKTVIGITVQGTAGTFVAPGAGDLIAVSNPSNTFEEITADDPSLNGTIDANPPILLGTSGSAGATYPLRGHGLATPPAAGTWVPGRILMAAGFTELRQAAAITGTATGGTTTSITLAGTEPTTADFYTGMVIQHSGIGTGIRGYSPIVGYSTGRVAQLPDTLGAAISAGTYTIPPQLAYVLSQGGGPLLSVSVWRDKRRYDYVDCVPSTLRLNFPTSGREGGGDLPNIEFALTGEPYADADDDAPAITSALLGPIPPLRAGKFLLDRLKLGSASATIDLGTTVAFAPNANLNSGSEAGELIGRTRGIDFDLNQMLKSEWDFRARITAQTEFPWAAVWGLGTGNRFAASVKSMLLRPISPGDRGGIVNLTGSASPNATDRSIALAVF